MTSLPRREVYKAECYSCKRTVEWPAQPTSCEVVRCPKCGASLRIDWRPAPEMPITEDKLLMALASEPALAAVLQ